MTAKEARVFVLVRFPQARYMDLSGKSPCHCIDDDYNDRYLAYGQPNRRAAWRTAARAVKDAKPVSP
jgi:hypothetical protein